MKSVCVVIPTLNAGAQLGRLLERLLAQTVRPREIVVVDSQSSDGTAALARGFDGVRVLEVARADFDHGGTRDWALRQTQSEFVAFMTQDALPVDENSLARLLAPFEDVSVAAVGGRQIAYGHASAAEKLVRARNYPAESRIWRAEDIDRLGVRAFLISDVFSCYRREAYLAVGGFDHPIMTNEDMLIAERLLHAGYALAYQGSAAVYHSHDLTLSQQFRRNLIVGRTMKRYEARFEHVQEMGEGVALARSVLGSLARQGKLIDCARFGADCAARLAGNRIGRWQEARALKKTEENSHG